MKNMIKNFINRRLLICNLQSAICNNKRGFTLIELAIVMVIIGIILGAVLKGQDLIGNARAKKIINWNKEWEMAQFTFFDRRGKFAGDSAGNGVIGDGASEVAASEIATAEIASANFVKAPATSITLGGIQFFMLMGYSDVGGTNKNVIVICKVAACGTALTTDELMYMESLDTSIDGSADVGAGNVRGLTAVTITTSAITDVTESGAAGNWSTTEKGLAYYFDRPY